MPVKVLLQLCSCASDDLKICVTDVLQDHTNSTETELHQVCVYEGEYVCLQYVIGSYLLDVVSVQLSNYTSLSPSLSATAWLAAGM